MKKRFWLFLLTVCMVWTAMPFGAFAVDYPKNPVTLPIGGQAYAADGWYRFAPTTDGLYMLNPVDSHASFMIYQTKIAPVDLAKAEQMIADGEQQLIDGRAALQDGEANIAEGKARYEKGVAEYERRLALHELARAEYERNLALVDLPIVGEAAREIVDEFEKEEATLRVAAEEVESRKKELEWAEEMLNNGRAQLADGEARIQAAKDFLAASKAGQSSEPTLLYTMYLDENELLRKGLFFVHAGSEYLIRISTDGDPSLACRLVCKPFEDVVENEYYLNPVYWAAANRITLGTDETHFSPNAPCTRAQVVTFLWRYFGCPAVNASCPFADVPSGEYYDNAVRWAVSRGITNGTDETHFSPEEPCTRAQVVTFLWRAYGQQNASAYRMFSDVPADAYYYPAVVWTISKGIVNGTDDFHFSPDALCTRAQVVTLLYRASR